MTQRIEFTNTPPTVAQCPKLELRLLARGLVEATRNYKLHTKEKSNESNTGDRKDLLRHRN